MLWCYVRNVNCNGYYCSTCPDKGSSQRFPGVSYSYHACTTPALESSQCRHCRNNVVIGRPFTVGGVSRTTRSENSAVKNSLEVGSWIIDKPVSMFENITYNYQIGLEWLQQAEGEHASVASFARHTLQLMSIGAPSELLVRSQSASIDEIKHAKMCYGLASIFLHQNMIPGIFDVENSLESLEIKDIIKSVIHEGCIEETLAALEAHFRADVAEDSTVKATLVEIAHDETRHAKLAWDTIEWVTKKYPDYHNFVQNCFQKELEMQKLIFLGNPPSFKDELCDNYNKNHYFRKFGVLGSFDRDKIRRFGIQEIIRPTYESGLNHFESIFEKTLSLRAEIIEI